MSTHSLESYQIKYNIGKGGFAQVYYAIHKLTGTKVAIKIIPKSKFSDDTDSKIRIQREIEILRKIRHPFVAELFDVVETDDNICIIMEYAQNGTLLNYLNEFGPFTEENAKLIFAQLIIVMKYLFSNFQIVHRDIKAENILLDSNNNIRVIDFGLSSYQLGGQLFKTQSGSPCYASPELLLCKEYTIAADIWSAGVLLYALVSGNLPFQDQNMTKLVQKIAFKELDYPDNFSDQLIDLLKKILQRDQSKRITLDEIMAHPWVKDSIKTMTDKLLQFSLDKEMINSTLKILGFNTTQIEKDLYSNIINQGTISYRILRREYFLANFPPLFHTCKEGKSMKSNSHNAIEALPRLDNKHVNFGNRMSLPSQQATPVIISKRRHCPSPVIHMPQ
ncbi:CAMK family protein kinase [Trichomonas vaginalis G3]|uniref:non-specific serine/threonine protein kinase n=1 Tax=Trichomonas vaginalis (strain ATCC PRA-98 / G3) TaxID=412133 RepID=A2F9P2_TRIV3|nr:protein serine/threonine kinase protein [Trichomonas vaginalis G3]EAX98372.1 CAMK family protein kinase [Trichomonas vaginalis G3]KAI5536652.1 protein serine/threonine kinase protein [Trichomonas vaginalis G3]|eukprot:XP_001311302.1 CAMK family protein kinase [Trichomonas vaginalis G3]